MRSTRAICVGGLVFASTCLAACGSSGSLLSAYQANELKSQLTQVSQSLSAHQCSQAANEITNFRSTVDGLSAVNQTLVSNLDQGAAKIRQLASGQCPATPRVVHHTTTTPPTVTTTSTPTQTNTTPTTPTQTNTTPTTPTQTTTTPTTPAGPGSGGAGLPGNGNGNGNGHGNGNGNGGGD